MDKTPLEYEDCIAFTDYLELLKAQGKVILFAHIPNETFTKSWKVKNRNKAMGVRSGIPDYVIIVKDGRKYREIWIEMKREKGGKVSPEQEEWLNTLEQAGRDVFVARGFQDAKNIIDTIGEW